MTAERPQPNLHESQLNTLGDPLRDQRKISERISQNLKKLGSHLDIRILGAFHTGIIGQDIKDSIRESDIVTTELPSEVVGQSREGIKGKALSVNPFWADVLDQANAEHKRIVGVTTNRAAVNGLRGLNDRWRKDEDPFIGGPDLVISTRVQGDEIRKLINEAEIAPSLPGQPFLATVHRKIDIPQQPDSPEDFPYNTVVDGKDGRMYFHYLRPFNEEGKVLIAVGDWSSPMEFAYSQFDELVEGYEGIFPEVDYLVNFGVQHLMRLRGDRTQVNGMLKEIDIELKRQIRGREAKPLTVTHIGGAAHDKNLLGILNDLFQESQLVDISEQFEKRIIPLSIDPLIFFSTAVPVKEGLLATNIFHDQILVNMPRALAVLRDGIGENKEELRAVGKRKKIVDQYGDFIKSKNLEDIHIATANYLLSLLPEDFIDGSRYLMGNDFLLQLAQFVLSNFPEKTKSVLRALVVLEQSNKNFPLIVEDEFKASKP
jgi:hypothetical protein